MNLDTLLVGVPGIAYTFGKRLERLGLLTVRDLIYHFPFRYDDFSNVTNSLEAQVGQKVTLQGEIWSIKNIYTRSRKILTQAIFNDGTSPIELTWFNQGYLTKSIQIGDRLQISGKISKYKNKVSIVAPQWEKISTINDQQLTVNDTLHTGRLVPVYPETEGVSSKWIRTKIAQVLPKVIDEIKDPLPLEMRGEMLGLAQAINKIHFPEDLKEAGQARDRLGFDELFYIQLATQKARLNWRAKPLVEQLTVNNEQLTILIDSLPFELTKAQSRVTEEILKDLQKEQPMNRLVQGEVGSGKTVVAAIIAYIAHLNGLKTLYMAPTEILAFQHFATFKKLLESHGLVIGIYTGSKKFNKKSKADSGGAKLPRMTKDRPDIIIGTHALLSDKLKVDNIGLVIVDEQQRFGVEQRAYLRSRAKVPHFLTMTATPIPRTVALTIYGDLDLSVIDELPKGRQKISTHVVPKKKRDDAYKFIEKHIKEGSQAYIITPLIDLSETILSAKAATHEFERLQREVFPKLKLGLMHGRLKSKEKEQVINDFKDEQSSSANRKIDILVSTSVVEVGVDIPNATIMLIENAERFGLAQLHQLRGRVGRGEKQSFCLLFSGVEDPELYRRLKNLENIDDGLKLAELDLKIRGSGQIFGTAQSGRFELKIASLSDLSLIEKTKSAANKLLNEDPSLDKHPLVKGKLAEITANAMPD